MKKKLKILFLSFVLLVFICLFLLYKDQRVTVLGYHDFTEGNSVSNMQMNIKKFDKQMKYLKDLIMKKLLDIEIHIYIMLDVF